MKRFAPGFLVVCAVILAAPCAVAAQEQGDTGITMGYPESVGFIFHVTKKIAIRPEFVFSRTSTEIEGFTDRESSSWVLGIGVSGIIYVAEWDRVRAYVSPRYAYTRGESNSEISSIFDEESTTTTDTHLFAGSFGAQYTPHPRFSIFGEIGLGYTKNTGESTLSSFKVEGATFGTRTGAGIIFYF